MKKLIKNYTFNPSTNTIEINEYNNINLEQILIITNVTDNIIIYNFSDELLGGTMSNNILTLKYDVSSMNSDDLLQIFVEVINEDVNGTEEYGLETNFTYDTNMSQVLGSQSIVNNGRMNVSATYGDTYASGKLIAIGNQLGINCVGCPNVTVQLSGVWVGTATFEATLNNGDYLSINGMAINGSQIISSATSNGIYKFNTSGIIRFRVRCSAYTSGTMIAMLTATGEQGVVQNFGSISGSQSQPITQRATTFETTTYDTNLATILGSSQLYTNGFSTTDFIQSPTINPTQPTKYSPNMYSKYPQLLPRLRVEIGGDKKLPIAQEQDTNRILISYPELYSISEQILMQLQLLNQNFATTNNIPLINGTQEIR